MGQDPSGLYYRAEIIELNSLSLSQVASTGRRDMHCKQDLKVLTKELCKCTLATPLQPLNAPCAASTALPCPSRSPLTAALQLVDIDLCVPTTILPGIALTSHATVSITTRRQCCTVDDASAVTETLIAILNTHPRVPFAETVSSTRLDGQRIQCGLRTTELGIRA